MGHIKNRILLSSLLFLFFTQTHTNNLQDYFEAFDEYSWWVKGPAIFAGFVGFYTVTRILENSLSYLFKPAYIKTQQDHEQRLIALETFQNINLPNIHPTFDHTQALQNKIDALSRKVRARTGPESLFSKKIQSLEDSSAETENNIGQIKIKLKDALERLTFTEYSLMSGGIFKDSSIPALDPSTLRGTNHSLWASTSSSGASRGGTPRTRFPSRPTSPGGKGKEKEKEKDPDKYEKKSKKKEESFDGKPRSL